MRRIRPFLCKIEKWFKILKKSIRLSSKIRKKSVIVNGNPVNIWWLGKQQFKVQNVRTEAELSQVMSNLF